MLRVRKGKKHIEVQDGSVEVIGEEKSMKWMEKGNISNFGLMQLNLEVQTPQMSMDLKFLCSLILLQHFCWFLFLEPAGFPSIGMIRDD